MPKSFNKRSVLRYALTMFLLIISATAIAVTGDNFKMLSQSGLQIDLRFNLGEWNLQSKTENGIEIKSVVSDAKNNLYVGEEETLPLFSTMIAIPEGMDVELVTNVSRRQEVRNVNLVNSSAMQQERSGENLYPHRQFAVSEPGQLRDFRVVTINVYPFQLDTASNNLSVIEEAELSLRLVPSRDSYLNSQSGTYSRAFDKIYRGLILNYDNLRDELTPTEQPVVLVIYGYYNDATYLSKIDEYVTWKKQKGYKVYTASTNEAGTTSTTLKAYIQNAYDNWTDRPDVVVLIGDTNTSATLIVPYSPADYGDYYYMLLAGGDQMPDIQLGRISVETLSHFNMYLTRMFQYERDIVPGAATWLDRMLLVGDPSSSGISTIFTSKFIKEISQVVNPNYTYNEVYASPFASSINTFINQGVGFFNYRGYLGMSGWSPGTSLINANKLNHGVFLTCSTSTFYSGSSYTENYLRQGTETIPYGGVTATGMATSSTHTGFNNCLDGGIFHGIFNMGMRNMGEATFYTRGYLISEYGTAAPSLTQSFLRYLNLMGDPTVETWVTIPKVFSLTAPTTIFSGTSTVQITVKNATSVPVQDATVNLWQASSNLNLTVYTDASGRAYFTLPTNLTGSIVLTVSKHDFKPTQQTIAVSGSGLVYQASIINDDTTPPSSGNNNGIINAGEVIEYRVQLRNTSSTTISSISATISHTDPYISFGLANSMTFPNATAGSIVTSTAALTMTVSPTCPDNHPVNFNLAVSSSTGNLNIPVQYIVRAADLDYVSHTVTGANSYLEIGETASMFVTVTNTSSEAASAVYGKLRSLHNMVTVTDSVKYFGNVASGSSYSNSGSPFVVTAAGVAITGMVIPMELILYNSSGYSDTEAFSLTIGNATVTDPVGQDEYGYFIFDMGDTGYPQCPTYNWIEINPNLGGSGTLLAINDPYSSYDEGDQVGSDPLEVVTLPFTFKFYGVNYTQATVVSNGFIAMGVTANHDFRNWRLPGALGPNPMIAPFWDDLATHNGGQVYAYNDAANHRYIVQWDNMKNGFNGTSEETFQVILFDPAYYPTSTGDGPIKFQYKVFNNVDNYTGTQSHGCYATIGIKDHNGLVGLEYSYLNQYPTAAQPLGNQKALYITTADVPANQPFLTITQTNLIDTNGNGVAEPGETLDVRLTVSNAGSVAANSVSLTITESDPWINITGTTASFGNIAAGGSAVNTSGLIINVLPGAPDNYTATVNATITCSGYTFYRTFTIVIHSPSLQFGYATIQDTGGNNNGNLDPGETVTVLMPLNNLGGAPSSAGTATLTCSTPGITVNNGTASFTSISAYGTAYLSFTVTASSGMAIGTSATFVYNATAGAYTANRSDYVTVGLILEDFETGNFNMLPWTFSGNADWTIDNTQHYSGAYSARSGVISHSQTSTMQTIRVLSAPGNISFWYKVSSENNYDYLRFYVDGVQQGQWAGEAGWAQATYNLAAGVRTLAWTYSKDGSVSTGSDCAWVDYIIFPASTTPVSFNPPRNLTASASNLSVLLNWDAPASGTPTGYKIYKNGGLMTTVTALTYTDLAVINGTTYNYFVRAAYAGGDSDPTDTVSATPNTIAPTNLVGVGGNGFVNLTWSSATGRQGYELNTSDSRAISGYKVYRNGTFIANVTGTSHQDTGVVNETTYSYYVTTVYANPAGESVPSNTVQVTPTAQTPSFVVLGNGTAATGNTTASPINIYYRSSHGQSVYTAAELNDAGVFGPTAILQIGFDIVSQPSLALPSFIIRMKHTTDNNVANWQTAADMITVYTNASYMPTAGGYEMLTLSTPFLWNGVDNIVIDTAFDMVATYSSTGTVRYTTITSGYRYTWNDTVNQTNVFSGGSVISSRPNVRLSLQGQVQLDAPEVLIEETTQGCRLYWTAVSGASRYLVLASNDCETGFVQIAEVTATQYTDTAAHENRFYKVIAADGAPARANITKE